MKNTEAIKEKIVDGYRRGICDKNGNTLPKSKQGKNGKGSAFHNDYNTDKFRQNYEEIYGESKLNVWPRDGEGNLID